MNHTYLNLLSRSNKKNQLNFLIDYIDETGDKKYLNTNCPSTINLWQYLHMIRIGQIPIIDLILVYIFLYFINRLYLHYDYKYVLVATIPVTIFFCFLTIKNMKLTLFIIIILIISILYLLLRGPHRKID